MNVDNILVTDVVLNPDNPRKITDDKFMQLVESLLVFPKMLELRPAVLEGNNTVLGGNQRTKALLWIKDATKADILKRLNSQSKYQRMTDYEQEALMEYWQEWQQKPVVPVCYASNLTEEEQAEFLIKDNLGFGQWDWDMLANNWDENLLGEWGMDVWQPDQEKPSTAPNDKPTKDLSDECTDILQVVVDCKDEEEQEKLFNELQERGYLCRVLIL